MYNMGMEGRGKRRKGYGMAFSDDIMMITRPSEVWTQEDRMFACMAKLRTSFAKEDKA